MPMKKYRYDGPVDSSVTLKMDDGTELDVMLWRGKDVDLPEGHDYVQTLIDQKHIASVEPEVAPAAVVAPVTTATSAAATAAGSKTDNAKEQK
jgi:hypothetical protein